jgi:hypothetical protein
MTTPMPEPAAATPEPVAATRTCQNCGTPLLGPHCYKCGQPVHGLVRHFSSIMGDFADSVLNIDARVFRTLWPLFGKPGYLSCEYFEGRRVRYVSPVRLFVFLSIVTFFVAQFIVNMDPDGTAFNMDGNDSIERAATVADVEAARDQALQELAKVRTEIPAVPGAQAGIDAGAQKMREKAEQRIAELERRTAASPAKSGTDAPGVDADELQFNGRPWDPVANPVVVRWLPGFANRWINTQIGHGRDNAPELSKNPERFKDAVLSAIPSTLFVLLPIFALMLKIAYLFKRRLYMEHLIVALHSHAFLCLALLLVFGVTALKRAVPALETPSNWIEGLLLAWMPLYLLLMQKRVYAQGWIMTLLKYFVLGICYTVLMSFGVVATVLASLVWA